MSRRKAHIIHAPHAPLITLTGPQAAPAPEQSTCDGLPWSGWMAADEQEASERIGTRIDRVHVNARFVVYELTAASPIFQSAEGTPISMTHLAVDTVAGPPPTWGDLQRIKAELLGPDFEAVELYPAAGRTIDGETSHLWALPLGCAFPLGMVPRPSQMPAVEGLPPATEPPADPLAHEGAPAPLADERAEALAEELAVAELARMRAELHR